MWFFRRVVFIEAILFSELAFLTAVTAIYEMDQTNLPSTMMIVHKPLLYPQKVTIGCDLWVKGIITLYFFKNKAGHNILTERYRAMNNKLPGLKNVDVDELWFQQVSAICHKANETINLTLSSFFVR